MPSNSSNEALKIFCWRRELFRREVTVGEARARFHHQFAVMPKALDAGHRKDRIRSERQHHEKRQGNMRDGLQLMVFDRLHRNASALPVANENQVVTFLEN